MQLSKPQLKFLGELVAYKPKKPAARQRQSRQNPSASRLPRGLASQSDREQIGAVVKTRLTRLGVSDIRRLRLAWVIGYTFVGNGTNGTALSVYFQTASATYLIQGHGSYSSGQVPILPADADLGQTYVADLMKHFSRFRINRLLMHVDSLQPSTSNNMMVVVAPSRGPGGGAFSNPTALATASVAANTVGNVSSMKGAFVVDSWESKCVDISEHIAGGSGARQNEFEIEGDANNTSVYASGGYPAENGFDLEGLVPACFAVAGNCTTTGLENTRVHQISIEADIDLLDFIGGMTQITVL